MHLCAVQALPASYSWMTLKPAQPTGASPNGATTRWQVDLPYYGLYAQSGIHSLYADDYPAAITDANARLVPFTVPNNAYLHFAHAFGFESFGDPYYFDGGVLEYSTNAGSTWLDAGSLIDFNGYKGTIYNDWNNPLRGRPAFVGSSHGYISTRLNLASLAGQTVTFRWRMGLDDVVSAWGWWVDNVKVYTCAENPPAAATLNIPNGVTTNNPTYTWNKVSAATWYYLYVSGPSGYVFTQWYRSDQMSAAPAPVPLPMPHQPWVLESTAGGSRPGIMEAMVPGARA